MKDAALKAEAYRGPGQAKKIINFRLRFPPDLHEALAKAADAGGRPIHAEIMMRLYESFIGEEESK